MPNMPGLIQVQDTEQQSDQQQHKDTETNIKHNPDGYPKLLTTRTCLVPVRKLEGKVGQGQREHLPLFTYDDPHYGDFPDFKDSAKWRHFRIRESTSEDAPVVGRSSVRSFLNDGHFEVWNVRNKMKGEYASVGKALMIEAILHGMSRVLEQAMPGSEFDTSTPEGAFTLVELYEQVAWIQAVQVTSEISALAFNHKMGFRLLEPEELFCAAPNPWLVNRLPGFVQDLEEILDQEAKSALANGTASEQEQQQQQQQQQQQRERLHAEASMEQLHAGFQDEALLAEHGVKWPLPQGVAERFRRGTATEDDCQAVELLAFLDAEVQRLGAPFGHQHVHQDYSAHVQAYPGRQDYLAAAKMWRSGASLLQEQLEMWGAGEGSSNEAREVVQLGDLPRMMTVPMFLDVEAFQALLLQEVLAPAASD